MEMGYFPVRMAESAITQVGSSFVGGLGRVDAFGLCCEVLVGLDVDMVGWCLWR